MKAMRSPIVPGRLVSASDSTWNVDNKPFVGHNKSIEDLQHKRAIASIEWSPHEASSLAVSSDDNQLT
nr:hypothetical protein [Tanacetum cinerariifolium]